MDNEATFGPVFHRLGFAEAIERDLLTDYQVVVVGVDDATYRDWAQRGRFVTIDGTEVTDARTLAGTNRAGQGDAPLRPAPHDHLPLAGQTCPRVRPLAARGDRLDARAPATHRTPVVGLRIRRDARRAAPCAAATPRQARPRRTRAAGQRPLPGRRSRRAHPRRRGLHRPAPLRGRHCAGCWACHPAGPRQDRRHHRHPGLHRHRRRPRDRPRRLGVQAGVGRDQGAALTRRRAWRTTRRTQTTARSAGSTATAARQDPLRPARKGRQRFRPRFRCAPRRADHASWEFWFGILERFVERHGHARVPRVLHGRWIPTRSAGSTRNAPNTTKATLHADRQHRLQDLPGWTWDPDADQWEEGFSRLLDYVERHGDAHVPAAYTVDGYRLGRWVIKQRAKHAEGTLDADRQRRLDELPGWTWDPSPTMGGGFPPAPGVRRTSRHARVPASYTVDGYPLGHWVDSNATTYNEGTLDADRQRRLQDVPGWTWDPIADQWEEGFSRLLHYVK